MTAPDVSVSRYQGDLQNPDTATAQTVELMCRYIQRASEDPMVKAAARQAVGKFRGGPLYASVGVDPWKSTGAQCESIWWWCKHVLRFVHHDGLIQLWFNERDQLQLLISPDLLLRMGEPRGDCAIYTMLECAMLQALGVPFEIVTAAVDPGQPDVFSHVYPRALLPNGRRLNLDASHGRYPGWEVPKEHIIRKQIWDMTGNPIPDDVPRFNGLHDYRGLGQTVSAPTLTPGIGSDPTLFLLLAGIVAALWFLPGWSKLIVPVGVAGWLASSNWAICSQSASDAGSYLIDNTTGKPVPGSRVGQTVAMGCPVGHSCQVVQGSPASPQWGCLLNPFPGGL